MGSAAWCGVESLPASAGPQPAACARACAAPAAAPPRLPCLAPFTRPSYAHLHPPAPAPLTLRPHRWWTTWPRRAPRTWRTCSWTWASSSPSWHERAAPRGPRLLPRCHARAWAGLRPAGAWGRQLPALLSPFASLSVLPRWVPALGRPLLLFSATRFTQACPTLHGCPSLPAHRPAQAKSVTHCSSKAAL